MSNLLSEAASLVAFVKAAEVGSFSAAARQMDTTPSAVSKSVARIERVLGVRLFLRSTRALTLTADGQRLLERVGPLLRDLQNAGDDLGPEKSLAGRLKISMPSEIARLMMDTIFERLAVSHPDLHLIVGTTDRFVDVIREDYDVAFRVGHIADTELTARKLGELETVLVASPALIERSGLPITIDELAHLPFARYFMPGRPFEITFKDGTRISPKGRIECDSAYALRTAAIHGLGVAHVMRYAVSDDIEAGRLIQLLDPRLLPSAPLTALHAFGSTSPLRIKLVCDLVAQELRSAAR